MKNTTLDLFLNKIVSVLTVDNKVYIGNLVGFDQLTNIILQDCIERVYNKDLNQFDHINKESLVLRGDSIGIVGELNENFFEKSFDQQYKVKRQKIDHNT